MQSLAANAALANVTLPVNTRMQLAGLKQRKVMIYVHTGELITGDEQTFNAGKLLILSENSDIDISSQKGAGILILAGNPLEQPIAHMGPFVMTTQEEIKQAVRDYQNGEFGNI